MKTGNKTIAVGLLTSCRAPRPARQSLRHRRCHTPPANCGKLRLSASNCAGLTGGRVKRLLSLGLNPAKSDQFRVKKLKNSFPEAGSAFLSVSAFVRWRRVARSSIVTNLRKPTPVVPDRAQSESQISASALGESALLSTFLLPLPEYSFRIHERY